MNSHTQLRRFVVFSAFLGVSAREASAAAADVDRRGLQIEGIIGGAGCIPGRAPCRQDDLILDGSTNPSFAVGAALGFRPFKWLMFGAMYRWGMFNPDYDTGPDGSAFDWGGQHTAVAFLRPILPIWRIDLGVNLGTGFARQVFHREGDDLDYSQGVPFLVGPTFDIFVTKNFFLGVEVDFIFNTQRKICEVRGNTTTCFDVDDEPTPAPTHQVIFGFHMGGVAF